MQLLVSLRIAKSRGQIHWHQLSWREDRQPHQLLDEARQDGCEDDEYAAKLSQWANENFAMTSMHPAGSDEEGKSAYEPSGPSGQSLSRFP